MNKPDRASLRRGARIVADTLLGYGILAVGLVLLVTPGPGLLAVVAGLALLARHYHFADQLKQAALGRIGDAGMRLRARRTSAQWSRREPSDRRASPQDGHRDDKDTEAA